MSKITSLNKQNFFKTFFSDEKKEESKEINGFVLFKHWNGHINDYWVDLFTVESFKKRNEYWKNNQPKLL